jgi:predicted N-acyltransferase
VVSIRPLRTVKDIARGEWDALDHGPSPVLEHGFLLALEESKSIGAGTGWEPVYLCAVAGGRLVGAVCTFVKTDSYGEYIFDWAWARASEQAGLPYYPKLVIASPFTPVTGRRILLGKGVDRKAVASALVQAVEELARERDCGSIHWLFTTGDEQALLEDHGFAPRASYQFHWDNRGYENMDAFLEALTSRRRKQIKKERARAQAEVGPVSWVPGPELSPAMLAEIDGYYRQTVMLHGGFDYLQPGFFERLHAHASARMLYARTDSAGAFFLETPGGLYGRYWGSRVEAPFVHFELAYYAAIERAIQKKTPLFEAGAQGEHKLLRGLEPRSTYSAHRMLDPRLDRAVRQFLRAEAEDVAARMRRLSDFGPYRQAPP